MFNIIPSIADYPMDIYSSDDDGPSWEVVQFSGSDETGREIGIISYIYNFVCISKTLIFRNTRV
jgi:hypothetical protein